MGIVGGHANRTFRRSYLRASIANVVLSGILASGSVVLTPLALPRATGAATTIVTTAAAIAAVAVLWGAFLWVRNIRVVITDRHIEVWRPFVRLHSWDRARTRFRAVVTEHRTRGMRSSTARALVAVQNGGATTTITLVGFDGRTFAALVAALIPPEPRSARTSFDALYPSTGASEFRIDVSGLRRVVARRLALVAGLIATLVAAGAVHLLRPAVEFDPVGLFAVSAVGVVSVAGMLGGATATAHMLSGIPQTARVGPQGLELDGIAHAFDTLLSIQVAPSTYVTKRIVLTDLTGAQTAFTLGNGTRMVPDYGQFVRALIESSAMTPGLVTFDLG
jgi:hypothetical protein